MFQLCIFLCVVVKIRAEFESFIIGGSYTPITRFPHSACIITTCEEDSDKCGASILNELFLLTAAHCLYDCAGKITDVTISVGSRECMNGEIRHTSNWTIHENYDPEAMLHDIAIIKMSSPIHLNASIGRVAIMKEPPYDEPAQIAGWGVINVKQFKQPLYLKYLDVKVWDRRDCVNMYKPFEIEVPPGAICASGKPHSHSIYVGDSGSALVVRGYIQIGLVSFGSDVGGGPNLAMYTDLGYHDDWIIRTVENLCSKN